MISYTITLNKSQDHTNSDTEELTNYSRAIMKTLLSESAERTLSMPLTIENQLKFAEELGYRQALLDFASYFRNSSEE